MQIQKKSSFFLVFLAITILFLQAIYYLSGLAYTSPVYFFVLVIIICAATLYSIFVHASKKTLVCLMLLLTATFMNLTYVYYSSGFPYIPPLDAIYHWKTAEAITTSSRINLVENATHIEFEYSSFPGFHLFISLTSQFTGIDSVLFTKLVPIFYSLLPFLVYIIARRIFPSRNEVAGLAAFITIFLPKWYSYPSYSRFVMVYILLLFFFLIALTLAYRKEHFLLALVSITALSITHHIMTYIIAFFIVFTLIFSILTRRLRQRGFPLFRNASSHTISYLALGGLLVCALLFPIFSSPVSFEYHIKSFISYFSPAYVTEEFSRSMMGFYTGTEQVFILASIGLAGLVGLYGLINYLRRDRWIVTAVAITVFYGSVFAISIPSLYTNPTIYNYVSGRMTFILFIVLAPFIGSTLAIFTRSNRRRRIGMFFAALLLLSLAFTSVDLIPREYYYFSQEKSTSHLWAVRDNSVSLYSSLLWVNRTADLSAWSAIGDVPLFSIGHGMLNLNMQQYWPLFEDPLNGNEHFRQLTEMGAKYIFINMLLTEYREQTDFKRFIGPIPASNLTLVTEEIGGNRIYDNEIISIIYIHEGKTAG